MKMAREIRGAATVGQITELTAWEADLILYLRLWQDGESGQHAVWNSYAKALGPKEGRAALDRFASLILTIESNMLRPLLRRRVNCLCVGSDEAIFANMVRFAALGELHEASLIATLMVRPAHAEIVALMAADVGTTLQALVAQSRDTRPRPDSRPVHRGIVH